MREIQIGDTVMVCQTKDNYRNKDFNIEMTVVNESCPHSWNVRCKDWDEGIVIPMPKNYCKIKPFTMEMPNALKKAFKHVKQHYPTLSIVIIGLDCRWQYMDAEFNSFIFDEKIDVSILQEGADSVETLPFIYQENLVD